MAELAAEALLSASVILAREADGAPPEFFMVRRSERSHLGPALVFPGGVVRPDDAEGPWSETENASALAADVERRAEQPAPSFARVLACAVRELFEEAGVLLAEGAAPGADALVPARAALQREELSLSALLTRWNLRASYGALTAFSHWITPIARPSRFDTWFFVAEMPDAQAAVHCDIETTDSAWISARDALEAGASGRASLVFATEAHLRRLAPFGSLDDLVRFARTKAIPTVFPTIQRLPQGPTPVLDADLVDRW
ncbi:MAG: hypothetical protein HYX52_08885 [Chloroflexi bacterium]|nr:hypothetical protein [Chloroflexota bacterium]